MSLKPKILVVEDDVGVRDIIRTRLVMTGYDVAIARNGADALVAIAGNRPDAMVLDINMPELDGFGVLEKLHAQDGERIPTLVLTARHAAGDVKRAIGLGAKDYLTKPFSEGQLMARVARLFRARPPQPDSGALLL